MSRLRARTTRLVARRVGREQVVPLIVALVVLGSAVASIPISNVASAASGSQAERNPRIAIGGSGGTLDAGKLDWERIAPDEVEPTPAPPVDASAASARLGAEFDADAPDLVGPFLADGTLLKPIAVDTTIPDGKSLLRAYKVRSGDTLTSIAHRFGVSMMTIWWANNLTAKSQIVPGKRLIIPPVSGIVVIVKDGDTLDTIARTTGGDPQKIIEMNGLGGPNVIVGQTLIIPNVRGKEIPKRRSTTPGRVVTSRPSGGGSVRPPARYTGGAFAWPVSGGEISQYYHYGHYGIDIAADYGTRIKAAAAGTVTFAGWKSNGGGYQVWIAHGSGLYTTYNHMSGVSVGRGQKVGRGQVVGRVGQSGWATGPHLHFEVWRGPIWNGGTRVNPLAYL